MDQTPLPFEYLDRKTYNQKGDKTIWIQSSQSGWDKCQATIQLIAFVDGIPRVKPLIFFRGQGIGGTILTERRVYDPRVIVKFNPKDYANSFNIVEWLDEQIVPVLENQPTLLALDLFGAHKTAEVLDTFRANDITVSIIPGGCTSLVQPLDVSINRPFKDILKVCDTLPHTPALLKFSYSSLYLKNNIYLQQQHRKPAFGKCFWYYIPLEICKFLS